LIVYDAHTYRTTRLEDLSTLADVLGAASGPALAFDDEKEAAENLALLRVRPKILAGALYKADGKPFVVYSPNASELVPEVLPSQPATGTDDERLALYKPVLEKGERVGTLYLVERFEGTQRLLSSALIVGAVVLGGLLLAVPVSAWLGRTINAPIRDVTAAARRVMEHRDYSTRVQKTTQDEIGYLVDTFNAMLDEVGRRAAALEQADRRKDQFLAVLAHELRNPLNPIQNAASVLRLGLKDPGKMQWATEVIDRQSRHLARLLDDLMDVARITRNRIELRPQTVAVNTIVDMATEATRARIDDNAQMLQIEMPQEPIYLHADPARMAQVLGNLLNNAAKYTQREGRILLTVTPYDGRVSISIKDNGIGIAPQDLSRLFEMFTQLESAGTRAAGGLGIGLALVRALVEMHGGEAQVRSEGLGHGTEFIVTLPRVQAPAGAKTTLPQFIDDKPSTQRLKILVADDVQDAVHTLGIGLQILGHEVRTASNGAEALETAAAFRPDLAILDIGMPELDGYEVARHIRKSPWGQEIRLVALTGWGQRQDVDRSTAAGFDDHMTKPADFDAIARLIDQLLAARAAAPSVMGGSVPAA
jgi:signal transduction histidine kinase/CheY-like chemotaxis protein